MKLEEAFSRAEIIHNGKNTPKGSHTYMGFGWKIRKKYIQLILDLLEGESYEEWNFSDLISAKDFQIMNECIMDISRKAMYIDTKNRDILSEERQILAPTHEIPIYASLRDHIQYSSDLPLKIIHSGSAYRKAKRYPFPFSLGERRSFVEGHGIFENSEQAQQHIATIQKIMKKIFEEILCMPYIESERPLSTNNPISKYTLCQDIILPDFGRTQIAGMTYFHDDIFAKPFEVGFRDVKDNYKTIHTPSGLHFGFSDNLLLGTLVHSFSQEDERFYLPEKLMPYHVSIICENGANQERIQDVMEILKTKGGSYQITTTEGKQQKRKHYQKNKLQGIPVIIGINHNNIISCEIVDTKQQFHNIDIGDIPNIIDTALRERKEYKKNSVEAVYKEVLIKGDDLSMEKINELLGQGKIIQVHLMQNDSVVMEFEKKLQHGEVLGFQTTQKKGNCKQTSTIVNTMAHISKRF